MPTLTRAEAAHRAGTIRVESYQIDLDLTTGPERFRSVTTVRFAASVPQTFIEVHPARLESVRLNGAAVDPGALVENRLALGGLRAENELVVEAEMAYSNTGEGLHRFVDPADGRVYLYAMTFLDYAQHIFACFDQPDLKAPVTLSVTADPEWTVLANAPLASRPESNRWLFETAAPLATYFVTLVAGPYHSIRGEHDGIPLGLHCRASLAAHLDRDATELLDFTARCFDEYHELFGYRYPFGKYDQVFVPEFNHGAMENPGCVTFRDEHVFRSAVTDAERERRATVIAHEMAHQWFGDLVTMRWWDDLWLNESFANYLGVRVAAACGYPGAWTTFTIKGKLWGATADQRPSTHPVAPGDVPDGAHALLNFDGISYAKGGAALRQLSAWLGDDVFLAGLRNHIAANAYGNATLADLLAGLSAAAGRDLDDWAASWLQTTNVDTVRPRVSIGPDGRYETVLVEHSSPTVLRPHRIGVGGYAAGTRVQRAELELPGGGASHSVEVPALAGAPAADLLLLNDGDLSYLKVRLDDRVWDRLPELLPTVDDPGTRALVWAAAWDAVRDAERPATDFLTLVGRAIAGETETGVFEQVLTYALEAADKFVPAYHREVALGSIAHACQLVLDDIARGHDRSGSLRGGRRADPERSHAGIVRHMAAGPSRRLAAARVLASSTVDAKLLRSWLDGSGVPPELDMDNDLRWRVLYRLVIVGAADGAADGAAGGAAGDGAGGIVDAIEAELRRDRTAAGQQWAARCRAAVPTAGAKAEAWRTIIEDVSLSNRIVLATAEGFWQPEQLELCESYVERYFTDLPALASRRSSIVLEKLAAATFPRFAIDERTRSAAAAMLGREDLDPVLRRVVIDCEDELARSLAASRRADAEIAGPGGAGNSPGSGG